MITVKKELLDQDILEMENKTLKHGLATLQKTLNDMENKMTELKSKMHQKENELSRVSFWPLPCEGGPISHFLRYLAFYYISQELLNYNAAFIVKVR